MYSSNSSRVAHTLATLSTLTWPPPNVSSPAPFSKSMQSSKASLRRAIAPVRPNPRSSGAPTAAPKKIERAQRVQSAPHLKTSAATVAVLGRSLTPPPAQSPSFFEAPARFRVALWMRGTRQLAPAVARQHPIERRERNFSSQCPFKSALQARNHHHTTLDGLDQYPIDKRCFALN